MSYMTNGTWGGGGGGGGIQTMTNHKLLYTLAHNIIIIVHVVDSSSRSIGVRTAPFRALGGNRFKGLLHSLRLTGFVWSGWVLVYRPMLMVACRLMTSGERGFSLVTSYRGEGRKK